MITFSEFSLEDGIRRTIYAFFHRFAVRCLRFER